MMTTFAALMGAVPLAMGHGADGRCASRWASRSSGGLLVSQWLTLYTMPVIYLYLERLSSWLGRLPAVASSGRAGGRDTGEGTAGGGMIPVAGRGGPISSTLSV